MPADAIVLIPTYNEKDNLGQLVPALFAAAPDVDVLVIDDNSPDGTGALADDLAAKEPRVSVLHRPGKQGLGRAYLAGFDVALKRGYKYVLEMDCDFSHPPEKVPELIAAVRGGADLALGSRWVEGGGTVNWGAGRKLISRGGSLYARTILGLGLRDLTGGFKCFKRETLEGIELGAVQSTGYSFQIELTYRAAKRGFKIVEIPITFVDRRVGQSKMSRKIFLEALGMVWKLRLGGAGKPGVP